MLSGADAPVVVIERLRVAGVEIMVDVHVVAFLSRAGFSDTILRVSLEAEGIAFEYHRGRWYGLN